MASRCSRSPQATRENRNVDIVESILVDSYEKWVEITGRDDMKNNSGNWGKVGDETSVRVLIGKKIE